MAFSIIRPTDVIPSPLGSNQPLVYRHEPLRSRAISLFSQWTSQDGAIPEITHHQIQIFDAAKTAESWEELQVHTLNELEITFAAMDSEHPIIQKWSKELDQRISSQRSTRSIPLYERNALFDDEINTLVRSLLVTAITNKDFNEAEANQVLRNTKLTIDRIIRLVIDRRKTHTLSPSSKEYYELLEDNRKSYFAIDIERLGSEALQCHELVINESAQPIQALITFDRYKQKIPDRYKSECPFISINSKYVDIFFPPNYQTPTHIAQILLDKGFGEQFAYTWNEVNRPSVYFSPQEYIGNATKS